MIEQDKSKENKKPISITFKVECGSKHDNGTRTGTGSNRQEVLENILAQLQYQECKVPECRSKILHISGT